MLTVLERLVQFVRRDAAMTLSLLVGIAVLGIIVLVVAAVLFRK